jgi:hypothetical protein
MRRWASGSYYLSCILSAASTALLLVSSCDESASCLPLRRPPTSLAVWRRGSPLLGGGSASAPRRIPGVSRRRQRGCSPCNLRRLTATTFSASHGDDLLGGGSVSAPRRISDVSRRRQLSARFSSLNAESNLAIAVPDPTPDARTFLCRVPTSRCTQLKRRNRPEWLNRLSHKGSLVLKD